MSDVATGWGRMLIQIVLEQQCLRMRLDVSSIPNKLIMLQGRFPMANQSRHEVHYREVRYREGIHVEWLHDDGAV